MSPVNQPSECPICGYYLTTSTQFAGCRCVDPGHWQAAGLLSPRDYHPMAKIASGATIELGQRVNHKNNISSDFC